MKLGNVILTTVVVVAFVAMLAFAWNFTNGMMDILKHGQCVDGRMATNIVMRSAIAPNASGVESGAVTMMAAYDSLRNHCMRDVVSCRKSGRAVQVAVVEGDEHMAAMVRGMRCLRKETA